MEFYNMKMKDFPNQRLSLDNSVRYFLFIFFSRQFCLISDLYKNTLKKLIITIIIRYLMQLTILDIFRDYKRRKSMKIKSNLRK